MYNSCSVALRYIGSIFFVLAYPTAYKNGRLLLIETITDDAKFALINVYSSNNELQQLFTLTE